MIKTLRAGTLSEIPSVLVVIDYDGNFYAVYTISTKKIAVKIDRNFIPAYFKKEADLTQIFTKDVKKYSTYIDEDKFLCLTEMSDDIPQEVYDLIERNKMFEIFDDPYIDKCVDTVWLPCLCRRFDRDFDKALSEIRKQFDNKVNK